MPPLFWVLLPLSWLAALLRILPGGGVGAGDGKGPGDKRGNKAMF
jgi:hypothetical protein